MDVHDRGPRARRGDARLGDLLRGHRHVLGSADGVAGAGQRAGDHDVAVHGAYSFVRLRMGSGGLQQRMEAEVAEVARLAVDEEVVVGPLRGLDHDGAGAPVGTRELAAAPVGGHPVARVVHRPPVVAEAGVRGDAAGQPADGEERVRRSGGGFDPVGVEQPSRRGRCTPATARRATRAQSRAVAARPPPASATPSRRRRRTASRAQPRSCPQSGERRRRRRARWRARAPSRAPASRRCSS